MIRYQYKTAHILFIGINPHPGSFKRSVPFSNNKLFWYLLSDAGLIQESRSELKHDAFLKDFYRNKFNKVYKYGLVNLIERPTHNITFLKKGEEIQGQKKINHIIKKQKPSVVCFVGKITYQKFSSVLSIDFGWQKKIFESDIYVMHAPLRGKAEIRVSELKAVLIKASGTQNKNGL